MRILFITSEMYPLIKSGGLADVSAALSAALIGRGVDMRVVLPGYRSVLAGITGLREIAPINPRMATVEGAIHYGIAPSGVPVYVVDAPDLFQRAGGAYGDDRGVDWPDNAERFGAFAEIAAQIASGTAFPRDSRPGWSADLVHCHDWPTGLVPMHLQIGARPRPPTIMTVHSLTYQGLFPPTVLGKLGLPAQLFDINGLEFHGQVGFMKAGLFFCDRITTVSPTYAREIQKEPGGGGLSGLIQARGVTGILNGIDRGVWDPSRDRLIHQSYDADDIILKGANRLTLCRAFGLDPEPAGPIFALISRLVEHKGIDLVLDAIGAIIADGGRLALIGTGDHGLESRLYQAAAAHPTQVGVHIGYDEAQAHQVLAGADILLVPSRTEPCGLVQLYGLRYGTVPIARRTGGLADTITDTTWATLGDDTATGFLFDDATPGALAEAIGRAQELFRQPRLWRRIQRAGMSRDLGWDRAAATYRQLYQEVIETVRGSPEMPG